MNRNEKLKISMQIHGYTNKEAAKLFGNVESTIKDWLRGTAKKRMPDKAISKAQEVFGLYHWIWNDEKISRVDFTELVIQAKNGNRRAQYYIRPFSEDGLPNKAHMDTLSTSMTKETDLSSLTHELVEQKVLKLLSFPSKENPEYSELRIARFDQPKAMNKFLCQHFLDPLLDEMALLFINCMAESEWGEGFICSQQGCKHQKAISPLRRSTPQCPAAGHGLMKPFYELSKIAEMFRYEMTLNFFGGFVLHRNRLLAIMMSYQTEAGEIWDRKLKPAVSSITERQTFLDEFGYALNRDIGPQSRVFYFSDVCALLPKEREVGTKSLTYSLLVKTINHAQKALNQNQQLPALLYTLYQSSVYKLAERLGFKPLFVGGIEPEPLDVVICVGFLSEIEDESS